MSFRHFRQLLGFFHEASRYTAPDDLAVREAGDDGPRHSSFHRRIVALGALLGVIGAGLGVAMIANIDRAPGRDRTRILLAPLVFAAMGTIFGAAVACLFAPRGFLAGPVGRKWMQLIGTESVAAARVVCFLFMLLFAAILGVLAWAAWADMHAPPG